MRTWTTMNPRACALAAALLGLMAGCGGGGGGASAPAGGTTAQVPAPPVAPPVTQFAVGGTVEGLAPGATVTLVNGSETLTVGNGPFVFAAKLDAGAAFNISATAPADHTCKLSDGAGAASSTNGGKSAVACAPIVLAGVKSALQQPVALASDGNGNLYVLDNGQHAILKLAQDRGVAVLAGAGKPGYADGAGSSARFWFPFGDVVADGQGNLLVADGCNAAIRKVSADGVVTTLAGRGRNGSSGCNSVPSASGGSGADGLGPTASFEHASRIVADGAGGAIVLDALNHATVRRVSAAGAVTTQSWTDPATASTPGRLVFTAIARSSDDGTLFLSDRSRRIWKNAGGTLVLVAGGAPNYGGSPDGTGAGARFDAITDMVATPNGDLYVADGVAVRMVTSTGVVTTLAGGVARGYADGAGAAARFGSLASLTFDGASLVAIDTDAGVLRAIGLDGVVKTLAATPMVRGNGDGNGAAASVSGIASLNPDADGNLYFVNPGTHVIRKATPDGKVSTIAGTAGVRGDTDGPLASALFWEPHTVATGRDGMLWVAQRYGLRKILNGMVTTFEPTMLITDLTADADGNAIVTDLDGGITRFSPAGEKTELVKREQIAALLRDPGASAFPAAPVSDTAGNLYFVEPLSAVVYKRSKAGELSVFAGTLMKNGDADGPPGTATLDFNESIFMTIDDKGNLYLSSHGVVRMISPAGVVSSPTLGWGKQSIHAITFAKGKLYGMTKYALLQTWLP